MTKEEYKQWRRKEQKKLGAIQKAFKGDKNGRGKDSK
jgi:hypothetical protein